MQKYDIIGDVHGHATLLQKALTELGYSKEGNVFRHSNRKVIFLGDFIGKGPEIRETIQLVRPMVESGAALAVAGNHELHLLAMFRRGADGTYLMPHNFRNLRQIADTVQSFRQDEDAFEAMLDWMQTLALYLDLGAFRVAHASWFAEDIHFLERTYPENCLSNRLLLAASGEYSEESLALRRLLKGVQLDIRGKRVLKGIHDTSDISIRLKWWEKTKGKSLEDLSFRAPPMKFDKELKKLVKKALPGYDHDSPILFLGHYCLPENELQLKENIVCLDSCVYRSKNLTVYRWRGEKKIDPANLIHFSGS